MEESDFDAMERDHVDRLFDSKHGKEEKRRGFLVQYKNKGGELKKGIVYYDEQKKSFQSIGKIFIRCITDNFDYERDDNGKAIITLKNKNEVTNIGFIN